MRLDGPGLTPPGLRLALRLLFLRCIFFNDIPRSLAARPQVTIRKDADLLGQREDAFCTASKMAAPAGVKRRTASYCPGFVPLTH